MLIGYYYWRGRSPLGLSQCELIIDDSNINYCYRLYQSLSIHFTIQPGIEVLYNLFFFRLVLEVDSPKETSGWSSDSDSSQQTIIYGSGNGSTGGDGSLEGMQSGDNSSIGLSSTTTDDLAGKKKKKSKEASGHGKPSQVVQRRNARERKRVEAVNNAFQNLRKVVPIEENK